MHTIYFYDQNRARQQRLEKRMACRDTATLVALVATITIIYITVGVAF